MIFLKIFFKKKNVVIYLVIVTFLPFLYNSISTFPFSLPYFMNPPKCSAFATSFGDPPNPTQIAATIVDLPVPIEKQEINFF